MARLRDAALRDDVVCSIQRSLSVVGDRWTFLILRDLLVEGLTRFTQFQTSLDIATNTLADRLDRLVRAGVIERRVYRQSGSRSRYDYHPTDAGRALTVVLGAVQEWGDEQVPPPGGPSVERRAIGTTRGLKVGFIDDHDRPVDVADVAFQRLLDDPGSAYRRS